MMTATHLPELDRVSEAGANQKTYRVDPPLDGHEYVTVSAVVAWFSGPETYIFPSTDKGEITGFLELEGSYQGGLNHLEALSNAGYTLT